MVLGGCGTLREASGIFLSFSGSFLGSLGTISSVSGAVLRQGGYRHPRLLGGMKLPAFAPPTQAFSLG